MTSEKGNAADDFTNRLIEAVAIKYKQYQRFTSQEKANTVRALLGSDISSPELAILVHAVIMIIEKNILPGLFGA